MATIQNQPLSLPLTSTYAPSFSSTHVNTATATATATVRPSFHGGNINGVENLGWNNFYYDSTHVYLPMYLPYSSSSAQGIGLTNPSSHNHALTPTHRPDLAQASFNHNGQRGGLGSFPQGNFHPPGYHGQDWRSLDQCVYTNIQRPRVPTGPAFHAPHFPPPRPLIMPGQHFVLPAAPPVHRHFDPHLKERIQNQIEHYFSYENLVKDLFLRHNMDAQGWVSINLIATFNKVKLLTDDIRIILDALKHSDVVEVQGEKVRMRSDWDKWLLPPSFPVNGLLRSASTESPALK